MSTPYQRGHAFELRVKKELETEGYLVCRSPASKSPFDLLAIRRGVVALVQCKLRGKISRADGEALISLAVNYGALPILAATLQERGLIHYSRLGGQKGVQSWSP